TSQVILDLMPSIPRAFVPELSFSGAAESAPTLPRLPIHGKKGERTPQNGTTYINVPLDWHDKGPHATCGLGISYLWRCRNSLKCRTPITCRTAASQLSPCFDCSGTGWFHW